MKDVVVSIRLAALSILVCAVAYPLFLAAFGSLIAPFTAKGSILLDASGDPIGSERIAQAFTSERYFWPRPSAVDYDASATGGSNLSPTNPRITERALPILGRLGASPARPVPLDLLTASGSGVDPDISEAAALYQVPRIASTRGVPEPVVSGLVKDLAVAPGWIVEAEHRVVNVLSLNIELDRLAPAD